MLKVIGKQNILDILYLVGFGLKQGQKLMSWIKVKGKNVSDI